MQKIIVPIDFSTGTEQIVNQAIKMAKAFSGVIYFAHVEPPITDSSGRDNGEPIEEMPNDYPEEIGKLNKLAEEARKNGVETHAIFIEGVPALSILDLVQKMNADLIVMGTHGHGAVSRLFIGSVSKAIVNKAQCPVLLIPSRDA